MANRARPSKPDGASSPEATGWTFLTNHGHVLVALLERAPDAKR